MGYPIAFVRGAALALAAAPALPGCEACVDVGDRVVAASKAGSRLAERCNPGLEDELALPLTDAKLTATLQVIDELARSKGPPPAVRDGHEEEPLVRALEVGGLSCGAQTVVLGKVSAAIDRLRERRGLSPRRGAPAIGDDSSRARDATTEADIAVVAARFDEVNRAIERLDASGG